MKKYFKMKGYHLYLIPTDKFKNITISLKLQNNLDKETVSKRTLLSFMLTGGTKEYPSTQQLSQHLENLYGMKFGTSVSTKGKSHIINVNSVCINEEYLPYQEDLLSQQIQLLNDIFNHPHVVNGAFHEKIFKMKKKELKDRIISNQDDKFNYSLEKLFEYFGRGQSLGISTFGYLNDIDQITNEELYDYFLNCLKNDKKYIYVVGKIDESIVSLFDQYLSFSENEQQFETVYNLKNNRTYINEIIEKQDVTQAKLNIGYEIDANFVSDNHFSFALFNTIFGAVSQSKLFKVVREKESLCYYISSSYDAFNGVLVITAGIESKDYEKVKLLIQEQLENMQQGKFSQKDIEVAKLALKNAFMKTKDEPISQISLLFNRNITNKEETDEQYLEKMMAVTKEDIIKVCQNIKLDTIFLLKGRDE